MFRRQNENRIDEMANRLSRSGKSATIEDELAKYNPLRLKGPEKESWFHLRGIVAFQRGDRDTAYTRFLEARSAVPESGLIAFSLAQEHEFRGEVEEMFALFDEFSFPRLPSKYALAQARYAYLWGDFRRGLSYVLPILDCHFELKVADDTFLYLRNMPFFSQTWAYATALYELRGELDVVRELTGRAKGSLVECDISQLEAWLDAVTNEDYSLYIKSEAKSGYSRTRTAVLLAQRQKSFNDAVICLDEVHLTENDFPWLADILFLARAEAAHRHAAGDREELVRTFLSRQPMLFEPDHAFNFRLLAYQEQLRSYYQRSRQSAG